MSSICVSLLCEGEFCADVGCAFSVREGITPTSWRHSGPDGKACGHGNELGSADRVRHCGYSGLAVLRLAGFGLVKARANSSNVTAKAAIEMGMRHSR